MVSTIPITHTDLLFLFEKTLEEQTFLKNNKELYVAVQHIMKLKGKRLRPLLLLQANDMFSGNVNEALPAAMAIEMFHNFSLVHDDIMDEATIRRGKPTVHEVFGTNNAIIAGDMMLCHSYSLLAKSPQNVLPQVLDVFNKAAVAIMEGQHLDMQFEDREQVNEEDYLDMIEKKTSVLLAASLQIGAVLAGAEQSEQKAIYRFGKSLGMMFQIKDDLLDTYGSKSEVGKRIGGDIVQNKKTHLLVNAMNMASEDQRKQLLETMRMVDAEQKIAQMKMLFEVTGAKEQTEDKMKYYFMQAFEAMEDIKLERERKLPLLNFAESIYYREY